VEEVKPPKETTVGMSYITEVNNDFHEIKHFPSNSSYRGLCRLNRIFSIVFE